MLSQKLHTQEKRKGKEKEKEQEDDGKTQKDSEGESYCILTGPSNLLHINLNLKIIFK